MDAFYASVEAFHDGPDARMPVACTVWSSSPAESVSISSFQQAK
jgi:nucleotidyltransferase/DNA polymerase involved in DNA repair